MNHTFPTQATEHLRHLYHAQDFKELCKAFDTFVGAPTLPMWRGWLDVFFIYDAQWFNAFVQYHKSVHSNASRSIFLLLSYRKILHVRGNTTEPVCSEQRQLVNDIILATHGLLQPLFQDPRYNNIGFVFEALLHMVDAKSLNVQWRMHVVPMLTDEWRLIFLWGQMVIMMAHRESREAVDHGLSDCRPEEKAILDPLVQAYLSTDEQLGQESTVVMFSQDPLCGDIFAIDMAEYCFEQGDHASGLAWISERLPHLYDILCANEWLDSARELVQKEAPNSELLPELIRLGVERGLPSAIHWSALANDDIEMLQANVLRGNTDSMVALSDYFDNEGLDEQSHALVVQAASVFNSVALYLLSGIGSPAELSYFTQAVQRRYGQAMFDAALGILDGEIQWDNDTISLQKEGAEFEPTQAIELLQWARDAGVDEAAPLLFDVLSEHVDDSTFFALCYSAGQSDTAYIQRGYDKALALGQAERILEWSQLMIAASGQNEDVLYELGMAAYQLGRTTIAQKAWTDAANLGNQGSKDKLDDLRQGRLPAVIVPKEAGWYKTWRGLTDKFKRS